MFAKIILGFLFLFFGVNASANPEFFSLLDVRYENGIKKTFLAGPFSDRAWCQKLNQSTWDNVQPVCGNCKNEMQFCGHWNQLNQPYLNILNGEQSQLVYVIAAKKHRIVLSGASRSAIEKECESTAQNFRANGYTTAHCVR